MDPEIRRKTLNALKLLWTALAQFAAALTNLSDTIAAIDTQLRQRCGLDDKPALPDTNGYTEAAALPSSKRRKPIAQAAEE
jgi:hypothetical protein